MECWVEVDPYKVTTVVLLGRQDLGDKVVSIKKPVVMKNVKGLKD